MTQNELTILHGDNLDLLPTIAPGSVQTVVTSPPYYGLRLYGIPPSVWPTITYTPMAGLPPVTVAGADPDCDHDWRPEVYPRGATGGERAYGSSDGEVGRGPAPTRSGERCRACGGWRGELGQEPDVSMYVAHLIHVFRLARPCLRPDGTLWLNLGDSSAQDSKWGGRSGGKNATSAAGGLPRTRLTTGVPDKNLMGIPWRIAFAMQADGWYLRSDIIWHKPNPLPESVTDRPTRSHEHLFLFSVREHYYYDQAAIAEPASDNPVSAARRERQDTGAIGTKGLRGSHYGQSGKGANSDAKGETRNKRDVWTIATQSYTEAHYATMPEALVAPCVLAGSASRACLACGAGWERVVEKTFVPQPDVSQERGVRGAGGQKPMAPESNWDGVPRGTIKTTTIGCRPGCTCHMPPELKMRPQDLELIATPTGVSAGDDPSLLTGRAGLNRPRGDDEGTHPVTRYQQRMEAAQLKSSPHRAAMQQEAGGRETFAHYLRTDPSGARPIPPALRDAWTARGWLTPVSVPDVAVPQETTSSLVLDPFAGSGTTLRVALRLQRRALGIEASQSYVEEHIVARTNGVQVEMTELY